MDEKERNNERETLFTKHRENIYFRWGLTAFIVICACVIVAQFVTKLPAFVLFVKGFLRTLAPVLYGLVIAYLLDPIVERVAKALNDPMQDIFKTKRGAEKAARGVGIVSALFVAIVVVWTLIAMVLPQLIESITTIVSNLPGYYNTVSAWVTDLIDDNLAMADVTDGIMEQAYDYLKGLLSDTVLPGLQSVLVDFTSSLFGMAKAILNLIIGIIISVYLLGSKDHFIGQCKKLCYAALGQRKGGYVLNVCTYANRVFGSFIGGKILDSAIIGVLCFIGLRVLKLEYAVLIALIVGVTNIVPFFGPYLGAIPSAFLLLVVDPIQCLTFVIFVLILQQIDGNIIGPMILGDATGLSSFWVVVSILVFGSLWGVVGMIIGVPTFAVIYKIASEIVNKLLMDQGMSTNTDDYAGWNDPPRKDAAKWNPPTRKQKRMAKKLNLLHHNRAQAEKAEDKAEEVEEKQG